jgi:hypothetical protein
LVASDEVAFRRDGERDPGALFRLPLKRAIKRSSRTDAAAINPEELIAGEDPLDAVMPPQKRKR